MPRVIHSPQPVRGVASSRSSTPAVVQPTLAALASPSPASAKAPLVHSRASTPALTRTLPKKEQQRRRKKDAQAAAAAAIVGAYDRHDHEAKIPDTMELLCSRPEDGLYYRVKILSSDEVKHEPDDDDDDDDDDSDDPMQGQTNMGKNLDALITADADLQLVGKKRRRSANATEQDYAQHPYTYYVHFQHMDRRMDTWVARWRLRFEDEVPIQDIAVVVEDPMEHQEGGGHGPMTAAEVEAHEKATLVRNISEIVLGDHTMATWYFSPFPEETRHTRKLFFCEFCLDFFVCSADLLRHKRRCLIRHPPGNEVYRSKEQNVTVSVWEVSGLKEKIYCENLCYISKLFLDHKNITDDTTIFMFYVVTEVHDDGCHIVAYFSREIIWSRNCLACILTLPAHQRKGYGKFVISLSYAMAKVAGKYGTPERPLSDLGRRTYESYWRSILLDFLGTETGRALTARGELSILELTKHTQLLSSDVQHMMLLMKIMIYVEGEWVLSQPTLDTTLKEHAIKEKERAARRKPADVYVRPAIASKVHWTPMYGRRAGGGDQGGGYGRSSPRR